MIWSSSWYFLVIKKGTEGMSYGWTHRRMYALNRSILMSYTDTRRGYASMTQHRAPWRVNPKRMKPWGISLEVPAFRPLQEKSKMR